MTDTPAPEVWTETRRRAIAELAAHGAAFCSGKEWHDHLLSALATIDVLWERAMILDDLEGRQREFVAMMDKIHRPVK